LEKEVANGKMSLKEVKGDGEVDGEVDGRLRVRAAETGA
jgi:hypothetical protein